MTFAQYAPAPLPQAVGRGVGQAQSPATHCCPDGQALPQPPQLLASVVASVQKALAPLPHASGVDGAQPHLPSLHCCPGAHAWSHAPQ